MKEMHAIMQFYQKKTKARPFPNVHVKMMKWMSNGSGGIFGSLIGSFTPCGDAWSVSRGNAIPFPRTVVLRGRAGARMPDLGREPVRRTR